MTAAACGAAEVTVLVVCPSHRDHRELALLTDANQHRLLFHDYASIELEEMVAPTTNSSNWPRWRSASTGCAAWKAGPWSFPGSACRSPN